MTIFIPSRMDATRSLFSIKSEIDRLKARKLFQTMSLTEPGTSSSSEKSSSASIIARALIRLLRHCR